MRKKIAAAITSMFLILGSPVSAEENADKILEYQQNQTFEIHGESGVCYEIDPPSRAHIVSQNDGHVTISLDEVGDVYIRTIYPNGYVYVFKVVIGEPKSLHSPAVESPDILAQQVLELVNQERAKVGSAPLRLSKILMDGASIRAEEISRVYSHTRPDGRPCSSIMKNGEYMIGENIAAGVSKAQEVVDMWMNSPGHRANILNSDYTELGVGYFYKSDSVYGSYWVQIFKRPMSVAIRR